MKKENFVSLMLGTVGTVFFALGMCMVLIEKWETFEQGIFSGAVGILVLLITLIVRRKMLGKPAMQLNMRTVGIWMFCIAAALLLGVGMCMCMVWNMMIQGVLVGLTGILMLICLIPICKGLK